MAFARFCRGQPSSGPILAWPPGEPNSREGMFGQVSAPDGLLVQFLRDFGKTLLSK